MTVEQGSKVWTVRGVPTDLQKAVSEAARTRGMKLGTWVAAALWAALEGDGEDEDTKGDGLRAVVERLAERVEQLEGQMAEIHQKPVGDPKTAKAPPPQPSRQAALSEALPTTTKPRTGGVKSAIPLDHVEEADRLQAGGMSYARIVETKGWPYDRSALSVRVVKLRQSRAAT